MRLMVIISEPISEWIKKGEIVDRYYNPGDLFDEVYLVLCNNDSPDLQITQRLVGRASLTIKNFDLTKRQRIITLGLQPEFLYFWSKPLLEYARLVQPDLIRCHGATQNALAALKIKKELGVPYTVSLHTNPDVDVRGRKGPLVHRLYNWLTIRIEKKTLRGADMVMPVYQPIVPYLERLGVERFKVHYNILNAASIRIKTEYGLSNPARLICVGRLFELKNPIKIIDAVSGLPSSQLTIVGDGPLRSTLTSYVEHLGLTERVKFRPAVSNDDLCNLLYESDLFVVHSEHWEISKSVLEALLTGLPVIVNQRLGEPVPELSGGIVRLVENNAEAYASAISELLNNPDLRRNLGEIGANIARELWSPEKCEKAVVDTYQELILQRVPSR
jgi:glycosyltransferase involved in cell wall biosynthesis